MNEIIWMRLQMYAYRNEWMKVNRRKKFNKICVNCMQLSWVRHRMPLQSCRWGENEFVNCMSFIDAIISAMCIGCIWLLLSQVERWIHCWFMVKHRTPMANDLLPHNLNVISHANEYMYMYTTLVCCLHSFIQN